jgi:hypothetical protein
MIIGIDPGIVHTGVVRVLLDPMKRTVFSEFAVIDGLDAEAVEQWVHRFDVEPDLISIEQYRPRQKLAADTRMVQAEKTFREYLPKSRFIPNTGVRRLAPRWALDIFGIGKFPQSTHHDDLGAAARILYLGAIKDGRINPHMTRVVRDFMDGEPWAIDRDMIHWSNNALAV